MSKAYAVMTSSSAKSQTARIRSCAPLSLLLLLNELGDLRIGILEGLESLGKHGVHDTDCNSTRT
jgi:hypothetical protein